MNHPTEFELVVQKLAWTLVHSTWQFAAIALLLLVGRRMMRHATSQVRYIWLVVGMTGMIAASVATFAVVQVHPNSASEAASAPIDTLEFTLPVASHHPDLTHDSIAMADQWMASSENETRESAGASKMDASFSIKAFTLARLRIAETLIGQYTTPILLLWLVGISCFTVRLLFGWRAISVLRRTAPAESPSALSEMGATIAARMGVRRAIRFAETSLVQVPAVVGWLRPVVFLPTMALTGMSREQLEAVIAHEIAHLRRHDFVVNVFQLLTETVFFYHPAVWWVSRQIREQREHCCDDLAVRFSAGKKTYVSMLLWIEKSRSGGVSSTLAMSAASGSLVNRIQRLVHPQRPTAVGHNTALAISLTMLVATTYVLVCVSPSRAQRPEDQSPQKKESPAATDAGDDAYQAIQNPFADADDDPFAKPSDHVQVESEEEKREREDRRKRELERRLKEAESQLLKPLPPDPAAQQLGVQIQKQLTAVDQLHAFLIRTDSTNTYHDYPTGVIGLQRETSLENLLAAINVKPATPPRSTKQIAFGWRDKTVVSATRSQYYVKGKHYDQSSAVSWDGRTGWRHPGRGDYGRYSTFAGTFSHDYFRPTYFLYSGDHRFAWAKVEDYDSFFVGSIMPVEYANYQSLPDEQFGGEMCHVIRSAPRTEQFWISKQTGRLRGILRFITQGFIVPVTSKALQRFTGKQFDSTEEARRWYATAPPEDVYAFGALRASALRRNQRPDDLVVLSDYQEIAPNVSIPMNERHASWMHKDKQFAFNVRDTKVVETTLDPDLSKIIEQSIAKPGMPVHDWRHGRTHIEYKYDPSMPESKIRKLLAEKTQNDLLVAKTRRFLTTKLDEMIGKPAPKLPLGKTVGKLQPAKFDGKKTLLYFWASWCDPCKSDIAKLNRLNQNDWNVVGIHKPQARIEDVKNAVDDWNIDFPVVLAVETGNVMNRGVSGYPIYLTPYCVVIDANGIVKVRGTLDEVTASDHAKVESVQDKREAAPSVAGKVVAARPEDGLFELSLGTKDGIETQQMLSVLRNGNQIGQLRVVLAKGNHSVGKASL